MPVQNHDQKFIFYTSLKHNILFLNWLSYIFQEKVYNELLEIFGNSKRHSTYDDLKNMKYLDYVINETERLYPSVPYIGRRMDEDFQLSGNLYFYFVTLHFFCLFYY